LATAKVTGALFQANQSKKGNWKMRAYSLLFLRFSTGMLIILWGLVKLAKPDVGVGVANKYYGGVGAMNALQMPWGIFQVAIGLLVILGLFRKYVYPLQAAILCVGALAIWKYLLDPFGMYLLSQEDSQLLFFPSLGIAAATLVLVAFRDEDSVALDTKLKSK
jgi:putative oxidoreductase